MKFFAGENILVYLGGLLDGEYYDGAIGFFFNNTLGGVISYAILALVVLFAVIGLITTIKWFFTRKGKTKK